MSLVLDHFIEPLLAVKPEVQHEEPRRFLATLPELFEGETVEVYTEAVRQARFMARGHKFPSEDVLRKAIIEARRVVNEANRAKKGATCAPDHKPFADEDARAAQWARRSMKASNWGKLSIEEGWDRSMYGLMNSAMQRRLLDGKKLLPPEADYCLHPGEHDYYKRYGQPTSLDVGERCRHWGLSDAETAAIVARAENADERGL